MCAVVYNGLTLNVRVLPVNDYLAASINGAAEIPGYFIIWLILDRIGRKWPLCLSMLLGGVACFSVLFVPDGKKMSNYTYCHVSGIL